MPLLALLMSFLAAAIVAPVVIKFYTQQKWIDSPTQIPHAKKMHTTPVPRGGGIVVMVGVLLSAILLIPISLQVTVIILGAVVLMIVGIIDDVYDISPLLRLAVGIVVALGVAISGVTINYVTNPFSTGVIDLQHLSLGVFPLTPNFPVLSIGLTVLWIVWNMNIVNWSKGLDGQLPGVVAIAAIFIGILAYRFAGDPTQLPVQFLAFSVAGAYLGLLLWNVYPQRMMPGYGAGSLGGYFLSILAIFSGAKLATALLVLGVPTADAIFTISRRLLRGKSPFKGDRGHLHHKLYDYLGWSKPQIALFYWVTTAILGILALQLRSTQKLFTIMTVGVLVCGFLIWVKLFFSSSKPRGRANG